MNERRVALCHQSINQYIDRFIHQRTSSNAPSISPRARVDGVAHSRLVPSRLHVTPRLRPPRRRRERGVEKRRTRAIERRSSSSRWRPRRRRARGRVVSSSARERHVGETGKRDGEIGDAVRDDGRVAVLVVRGYHRSIDRRYRAMKRTRVARERDDDDEIRGRQDVERRDGETRFFVSPRERTNEGRIKMKTDDDALVVLP